MDVFRTALLAVFAAFPVSLAAQPKAKPAVPAAPPAAEMSTVPQQTTATFGDWLLRCTVPSPATKFCEVAQGVSNQDRPVAQIALGHPAKGKALQISILVPPSVSFSGPAVFATTRDGDPAIMDLPWLRCLPAGCLAAAPVADDLLRRVRTLAEPASIVFLDATARRVSLPFSPKGLSQALDALAKTESD